MNLQYFCKKYLINGIFLLLLIFPLIYFSYQLKNTFLDDSYITLTYSKHFFEEGKPLYNTIDSIRGNGQTSVLWMLLQSFFFYFENIDPIYINKSISFLLVIVVLTSLFNSFKKQKLNFIKIFILIFSVFYSFWSALNISHGLETIIYATVLFLFLKYKNHKVVYLLIFLLPFIRPESIIITLFFVVDTKLFSKVFFKRATCILSSVCVYLLYTIYYYDVWIPLPFLLKNIQEFSPTKIQNFIIITIIFFPIILFAIKNYKTKLIFYCPLLFFIIYYSFFIDEVMNFFDRYRFPLFSYYIYFLCYENLEFIRNKLLNAFIFLVSVIGMFKYNNNINNHKKFYENSYSKGMQNGNIYLGKYLKIKSISENKKFKIINSDAGAIAYYSECYLYDTWGLNNATLLLAKKNKNWQLYLSYLKKVNPDYIIIISSESHTFVPKLDFEKKIYNHFTLSLKSPILIRKFDNNYYYFLYKIYD